VGENGGRVVNEIYCIVNFSAPPNYFIRISSRSVFLLHSHCAFILIFLRFILSWWSLSKV